MCVNAISRMPLPIILLTSIPLADIINLAMRKLVVVLGILLLFSTPASASLSDYLNLEVGNQTVGTVTSVIDGDTIWVELPGTQTKVRLLSIDTPELPSDPYAQKAASFTSNALWNRQITLVYNSTPQWSYDRLLAVVVKDGEIFNIKLLEQGLAVRMFMNNALIKFPAWEDVEITARQQRLNIWSEINSKGIFINEINPNPAPEFDDEAEFVELFNNTANPVDIGSWKFICIYKETVIPQGTTMPANGYLIIARTNTTRFKQIYPNTPQEAIIIDGGTNLVLQNSYAPPEDLVLHLKAQDNSYQDSLTYNLEWDNGAADGTGKTLERKSLLVTNVGDSEVNGADDGNWDASKGLKGSPGKVNSVISNPLDVASWIISCQRPTGAICTNQSQTEIIPYKANIAALGLLEKGGYEGAVRAWIEWSFAHLETYGIIYDYKVENDQEIPLMDTTEAENRNDGTFLTLLNRYYQKTLDVDFLKGYQSQLTNIYWYLYCLQDNVDGLTWSTLELIEKLLINNTQSYQGLKDLESLYFDLDFFDSLEKRNLFVPTRDFIQVGIETKLWNELEEWYYWQIDNIGNKTDCNWNILSPDAVSQLYTISNRINLPESLRSATLYDTFDSQQPFWTDATSYCEMGYVASLMADTTNAQNYQNSIRDNVIDQGYPFPWDCQEAGFYLLMEDRLEELETIQSLITNPKELGLNFLTSKMQRAFGGIQAQFDNPSAPSQAEGVNHEVTSEATGQTLLYAAGIEDRLLFDNQLNMLKDNLLNDTYNLLVWKLTPNGDWWQNEWGNYSNATIDDLRAIRALLLATDVWGGDYLNNAKLLAQGLKDHNVRDNELRDYFSWGTFGEETSQEVVLSYIDLWTMNRLAQIDIDWEDILQTNKQIILGATTSVGLFYPRYSQGIYKGDTISMIHAGWIAENLARYWQETGNADCRVAAEKFLAFAKNEYATYGMIFGEYDVITGASTVGYEDTAIYSIMARLAFILGDFAFAKNLRNNQIRPHQNTEKKSQTVGCFGYDYENPYAFVCLESLLALLELEGSEGYLIRGKVTTSDKQPIEGVLLTLSGPTLATTTTNSIGEYEVKRQANGTYTITPSKQGYNFEPIQVSLLDKHYDDLNFTGMGGKINSVSPTSGTTGTIITISGEGFDGEEPIRISFGEIITVALLTSHPLGSFSTTFTAGSLPSGTITIITYGLNSTVMGYGYFFLRALDHFKIGPISSHTAGEEFQIVVYPLDAREQPFEYSGTASLTDNSLSISPEQTTPFPSGPWIGTVTITKIGITTIKVEANGKRGTSNPFSITPAPLDHFVVGTITNQTVGTAFTMTITAKDRWENTVNDFTDIATLTLTPQPSTITPTTTTNFTAGLWQGMVTITRAGTTAITVSCQDKVGTSNSFFVTPGSLDHFVIDTISQQTAGAGFIMTITAKDRWENTVTEFTDIATLTLTPQPSTITPTTTTNFTAGLWQGMVTLTQSGTTAITVSCQDKAGTSNSFFVTPGSLDHFVIDTITQQTAGAGFTITITAKDHWENTVTEFTDIAALTLTPYPLPLAPTLTTNFTAGFWQGTVTITQSGTTAITASCQGRGGTSPTFFVTPGSLDHFVIDTITQQTAGVPFTITITAKDRWENTVTEFTDIAALTLTPVLSPLTPTLTTNFIAGLWQGTLTITQSGTTAITASCQGRAGTSPTFFVTPGSLDHFIIDTITQQTAGVPFTIIITAKDRWENTVTEFTDIAALTLTPVPSPLTPTLTTNFTAGLWQGTLTITRAGTTAITANYQNKAGTSNPFFVQSDALYKIVINPSEIELGLEAEYKFEAFGFDKYGNKLDELAYTWETLIGSLNPSVGTWTLFKAATITTIGTLTATYDTIIGYATISLKSGTLSYIIIMPQSATVTIGGNKTFMAKGYDDYGNEKFIEGGIWTIESWMGSIAPWTGTQTIFYAGVKSGYGTINYQLNQIEAVATITILPGTHTQFKIGTISSPQTAGIPFNITITAIDSYNNPIENFSGRAKLSYSAGKIYPENLTAFVLGIWSGTITIENASDNASITVQAIDTPAIEGKSNSFNVQPNAFHHFNLGKIDSSYLVNSVIPLEITAEDMYGNTLTNYNGTFSLSDDTQTIEPSSGTFTSGKFIGSITIGRSKPNIKITVTSLGKIAMSNLFTILIDDNTGGIVSGGAGDEKTTVEIARQTLPADFYIDIDPNPQQQRFEINLANFALSHDPTSKRITNSLHLFQAYDKDNKPIQIGTNSFISISLPFLDENQDEFVDESDVRMKEETLKIYELKNSHWVEVKNSRVHPYENIVSARVTNFGVYMLIGQIIPANFDTLVVYPNPFKPIRGDTEITFDGLPPNTTIRIYDISASLIKEIENISTGEFKWDVQDNYGRDIPSGIYIYIVSSDEGMKKVGKIAIIR